MVAGEVGELGGAGLVNRQARDRANGFGLGRSAGVGPALAGDLDGVREAEAGADLSGLHDPGLGAAVAAVADLAAVRTFVQAGRRAGLTASAGWT